MTDREAAAAAVRAAFAETTYPGDAFLVGSLDGGEPEEEVGPFRGRTDWRVIDADFLDAHAAALGFFSEGAFRFFLPAYLIADLADRLRTADPVFPLTHGFLDRAVDVPVGGATFQRRIGRSQLINPRRYGAMTFLDHARARLSVFTREEAGGIVAYLRCRHALDDVGIDRPAIEAALDGFWLERARSAPTAEDLRRHLAAEEAFAAAVLRKGADGGGR